MDDVKNDSWLDEQWEDFSGLEEEAEMIRQIAEAENDLMRRYKIPASKKTPASRKTQNSSNTIPSPADSFPLTSTK